MTLKSQAHSLSQEKIKIKIFWVFLLKIRYSFPSPYAKSLFSKAAPTAIFVDYILCVHCAQFYESNSLALRERIVPVLLCSMKYLVFPPISGQGE